MFALSRSSEGIGSADGTRRHLKSLERFGPVASKYSNEADSLVIGEGVSIGEGTRFSGGHLVIGAGSTIGRHVEVHVTKELALGINAKIGDYAIIRGREIRIGREAYANHHAEIGGGSCFEETSQLDVGDWFHIGSYAMVNTAMPVRIGSEVGLGRMTNIYTHGAYLSELDGFPVKFSPVSIGSRVWIPSATVNPGVRIGDDVVIGVGSVVTRDIPSGSLALGVPCKILKEGAFPAPETPSEAVRKVRQILQDQGISTDVRDGGPMLRVSGAVIHVTNRTIEGNADATSERARDLLRRHGIRFKVQIVGGRYHPWDEPEVISGPD